MRNFRPGHQGTLGYNFPNFTAFVTISLKFRETMIHRRTDPRRWNDGMAMLKCQPARVIDSK